MRFLVAHPGPNFSVQDVYAGWVEALRNLDQQVLSFNLDDRLTFFDNATFQVSDGVFRKALSVDQAIELSVDGLYSTLYRTHPDVLLVISGFMVPNELMDLARFRGTKVVVIHTESPYEDDRQIAQAEHADLNLINDPTNIHRFPPGTVYVPHAYRSKVHCPGPVLPTAASDLVFVGTAFESRVRLFDAMDLDGIDVALAGNWSRIPKDSKLREYLAHKAEECVDNEYAVDLYRSAKVGLNYYRREGDDGDDYAGWAMGPREVEMAAVGLPFCRDPRPEGDELFPMLPTFTTAGEASDLVRWWLADDARRDKASLQIREAVADRTFDSNARALLGQLERT